jgi:CRISPR/Cas system-associated exonuclease Cas4 (RecB family)
MDNHKSCRASDRQKTSEEIAKEEREKLQKLENERLERMKLEYINDNQIKSKSSTDIFEPFVVKYNIDGKLIDSEKVRITVI